MNFAHLPSIRRWMFGALCLAACGLAASSASAQRATTAAPAPSTATWRFRPADGGSPPALVYDPCPGCQPRNIEAIVATCPADAPGTLRVRLPGSERARLTSESGDSVVEFKMVTSGVGELSVMTLRGKAEAAADGVYVERPVDPANIGYDTALLNTSVVLVAPTGAERLTSRGADMALNEWRKACQTFATATWSTSSFTREADWEFRPAAGTAPAALAQVPCRGCADPLLGFVMLACPASQATGMSIRTYWPGERAGVTVPFQLDTSGGLAETGQGRVQADATVLVPVSARATPGLVAWLAEGNTLRLRYLSSFQTIILPLKLRDRWRESCATAPAGDVTPAGPQATPALRAPPLGSRMVRYVGTYDVVPFLADEVVGRALTAGLRDTGLRRLRANLQVTGPIEQVGSMVVLRGQAPHRGGEEEAIVATDLSGELVEAAIMSGRRISIYSSVGRPAPGSVVLQWAQEHLGSRTIEYSHP